MKAYVGWRKATAGNRERPGTPTAAAGDGDDVEARAPELQDGDDSGSDNDSEVSTDGRTV